MKINAFAFVAVSAGAALADSHLHNHAHFHKHRARAQVTVTSTAPTAVASIFMFDGVPITMDQVCKGIANNELKFADGGAIPAECAAILANGGSGSGSASASGSDSGSTSNNQAGKFYQSGGSNSTSSVTAQSTASSAMLTVILPSASTTAILSLHSVSSKTSAAASASTSKSSSGSTSGGAGVTAAFPDGQLDCKTFPSQYGAVKLDYLGMGGWSGLQDCTVSGNAVSHIVTGISGDNCREGMMCSYACPPGYQKSQWPSTQGATGQSIGGLSCQGGKLRLTNPSLSPSLCIPGVGGVQAKNSAGGVVSICRTDYPGTESETIPVELAIGDTKPLTVPDAATYYTWQGKSTSAQYYLNPPGYGAEKACQWGSPGTPLGNYAPINFGVGYSNGKIWLSIFQNAPTTTAQYPGTVKLQGDLSGECYYANGQYCGVTGCNSNGCTVAVLSGTATYVIS